MCNQEDIENGLNYIAKLTQLRFEGKPFVLIVGGFGKDTDMCTARISNLTHEGTLMLLLDVELSLKEEISRDKGESKSGNEKEN